MFNFEFVGTKAKLAGVRNGGSRVFTVCVEFCHCRRLALDVLMKAESHRYLVHALLKVFWHWIDVSQEVDLLETLGLLDDHLRTLPVEFGEHARPHVHIRHALAQGFSQRVALYFYYMSLSSIWVVNEVLNITHHIFKSFLMSLAEH